MSKVHITHPGWTCSACGPSTKNREKTKQIKETGDSQNIYQSQLDKACFQHDIASGDLKDLPKKKLLIRYWDSEIWLISMRTCFNGLKSFW